MHLKIPLETLSTVDMEEMDTEESPPDPHVALRKQLETLVKDSQVSLILLNTQPLLLHF